MDQFQNIQQLSLVFVYALNLYVEDGVQANVAEVHLRVLPFQVFDEERFVALFDGEPFLLEFFIIRKLPESLKLLEIEDPVIMPQGSSYEGGKERIALCYPSGGGKVLIWLGGITSIFGNLRGVTPFVLF